MSAEEIRRRAAAYLGERPKCKPKNGEKSTVLRMYDIAFIAKIFMMDFYGFYHGRKSFGKIRRRRISRVIRLFDAGLVQKIKHGKYVIHDKPFAAPKRQLRVSIGVDGVSLTKMRAEIPPKSMPDFSKIFGGG